MKVTVKFFGLLSEVANCDEEVFMTDGHTVTELLQVIYRKHPKLQLQQFQIAQGNKLVTDQIKLTGELIALLPPFSGG
ncbi:MAG: MoaD/ThiS family protein [Flavobacteriaceae bacterium]|nr:MoaD/ThiS family protein [Flavobacteriaceae bacterium]